MNDNGISFSPPNEDKKSVIGKQDTDALLWCILKELREIKDLLKHKSNSPDTDKKETY